MRVIAERIEAGIGSGHTVAGEVMTDQDVVEDWIIKSIESNNGYGLFNLLKRLHETFPLRTGWDFQRLERLIIKYDRSNGSDLYQKISIRDSISGKLEFRNPISSNHVEVLEENFERNDVHGSLVDSYGGIKDAKQKVAFLLMKHFNNESTDYYSSGSTVTLRYWKELADRLGIRTPSRTSKHNLVKLIFDECQIDPPFDVEMHISSGSTVKKDAFIHLCDHFGVSLPLDLVDEIEEYEDIQISLNSVNPVTSAKMETIGDIVDRFVSGSIYVPKFQRNFRWPIKKQRGLIDSILLGIPLPSILLIKSNDDSWWLVDGRQRVTTLRRFIKPKDFQSSNTFHLGLLGGENSRYSTKQFNGLESAVQERILNTKIPVTYIEGLSDHRSAIYELFRRYNTGGSNLNGAEIRHAVFHENAHHMQLFRLAGEDVDCTTFSETTKEVRKLIRISLTNLTGFKAYERICRFFGYRYSPKGMTTANAIFKFFEDHDDSDTAKNFEKQFIDAAKFSHELFGDKYRFNRLKEDGESGSFGAWPYTIQMIGSDFLIHNYPDQLEKLKHSKDQIVNKWKEFYKHNIFNVRQNSTTLWNSQIKWCQILEEFIEEIVSPKTEYEQVLKQLHELDEVSRSDFIYLLKDKVYFEKLIEEAKFQGWV